jgi:hypothetical protein
MSTKIPVSRDEFLQEENLEATHPLMATLQLHNSKSLLHPMNVKHAQDISGENQIYLGSVKNN